MQFLLRSEMDAASLQEVSFNAVEWVQNRDTLLWGHFQQFVGINWMPEQLKSQLMLIIPSH